MTTDNTLKYHRQCSGTKDIPREYKAILTYINGLSDILEIGCHTGYFTKLLHDAGCSVVGVEKNPIAAGYAKKIAKDVIVSDIEIPGTLKQLAGYDNGFDAILFMHVLEHLQDPWKTLRAIKPYLKKNTGFIIITLPNIAAWEIRKNLFFHGKFEYSEIGILDKTHLRFFTPATAKKMVLEAGYSIRDFQILETSIPLGCTLQKLRWTRNVYRYWESFLKRKFPVFSSATFLITAFPNKS